LHLAHSLLLWELWASFRWSTVGAGDIRTVANTTRPGLVALLDDGSRHEFQLTRRRDFARRSITRAQLAALIDEIRASRPLTERASS
jgi:hypothetical protein